MQQEIVENLENKTSSQQPDLSTSILIRAEATPNPSTMKFCFSSPLALAGDALEKPLEFLSPAEAEISPLAFKIFGFPWTSSILLTRHFISVTKQDWVDWEVLAEPLAGLIQEHFSEGEAVLLEMDPTASKSGSCGCHSCGCGKSESSSEGNGEELDAESLMFATTGSDEALINAMKKILDHEIRPALATDGGDISFVKYENSVLFVQMRGACSGCPSSQATLKEGIEAYMKEIFPSLQEVVAV